MQLSRARRLSSERTMNHGACLLSVVPYEPRRIQTPKWTPRPKPGGYKRPPRDRYRYVPDHAASL